METKQVDISTFKKVQEDMVAASRDAWVSGFNRTWTTPVRTYTLEEVIRILDSGSLAEKQKLSRYFFDSNGIYKRIIFYYATLLTYSGILIPNPSFGKKLSTPHIAKRYHQALDYLDKVNLAELMTRISVRALIYGIYYGILQEKTKDSLVIFDLPTEYCRCRYRDIYGNDLVEFNITYFDTITDPQMRDMALSTYPKEIANYYRRYFKGKETNPWYLLDAEIGICFSFFDDCLPLFLDVIPATIQYDDAVDTERERELEEIRKIIVQHVPHLNDGQLLFEPEEALEMHRGAVNMMKGNKNLSILTSYADVDAIISRTAADNVATSLDKMLQNVYSQAGVTAQLFAPTGSQAIPYSINNDTAFMMILGNKYGRFFSFIINSLFGNNNVVFNYIILPITYYNRKDYITDTFKLAQSGYSFIIPALASGLSQHQLTSIKELENDVLKLNELLIPLSSSYTQSNSTSTGEGAGRPELPLEEKTVKTIQNEDAINNQGGSE